MKLAGAVFGIYYDEECTDENAVSRYDEAYTVVSDEDGMAIFYGLAEGTYYVKELQAPDYYVLSDGVLTIELDKTLTENHYAYYTTFANTPEDEPGPGDVAEDEPLPGEPTDSDEGQQPGASTDSNVEQQPDVPIETNLALNPDSGNDQGSGTSDSSSSSSAAESSSSAKTTDSNSMILYALLLAVCIAVLCGMRSGLLRGERIKKKNKVDR